MGDLPPNDGFPAWAVALCLLVPALATTGCLLPDSTDATVTVAAAPTTEGDDETEVVLVLEGLAPDARELDVLPGRRKAWSSIEKTSHGGHAALSLKGAIQEKTTASVDPGLGGFSQVDEAKLVHREGNASVQVTLAVFLDTECGFDRNTYLGSVAPGDESRARHLHESREHCGPI